MIKTLKSVLFLVFFYSPLYGATLPKTAIPETEKPPVIDGRLDDACWRAAAVLTDFFPFVSGAGTDTTGEPNHDTTVLLARDNQWLYIGLECRNEHMQHVLQRVFKHGDVLLYHDDSIEIFLGRDNSPGNRYYQYMLNFAGVKTERRISETAGRELGWNVPWPVKTHRDDTGWTAEMAIPLYILNQRAEGNIRLNFLRNKRQVVLDPVAGAKMYTDRKTYFWAPVKTGSHETSSFGVAKETATFEAEEVFLPEITDVGMGEYRVDGDAFSFEINGQLRGYTAKGGNVKLTVIDKTADGRTTEISGEYALAPRGRQAITLNIPTKDFVAREMRFYLQDVASGILLQEGEIPGGSGLFAGIVPELNYYTGETEAKVRISISAPDTFLREGELIVENQAGVELLRRADVGRENLVTIPVQALEDGANNLRVLFRKDGKLLADGTFTLLKLAPGPENEFKVNHFRRVMLKNGEPFFPFGFYYAHNLREFTPYHGELFRKTGVNFLIYPLEINEDGVQRFVEFAGEADKYGIEVMTWDRGLKKARAPRDQGLGLDDAKAYVRDKFTAMHPDFLKYYIKAMREAPNFCGYYSVDEPNLGFWQADFHLCKLFYKFVKEHDPYNPVFGLFARAIPGSTAWFDIIGYDVYTYPNWNRTESSVANYMAGLTMQLDDHARRRNQPAWMFTLGTALDVNRCPRGLSGREQLLQAYTAIINGARGYFFYVFTRTYTKETWDALRELGMQLEYITPAIMGEPVDFDVEYVNETFDPYRYSFPTAQVGLFRFPDGRYLLMVANSKNHPVEIKITIPGMAKAEIMFLDTKIPVSENTFSDRLPPFGTRSYALYLDNPNRITVSVDALGFPEEAEKVVLNEVVLAEVRKSKNRVPNPSFDWPCKIAGLPDFYHPYNVLEADQVGVPGSRWYLDEENPKFGQYSLCMHGYASDIPSTWRAGTFGIAYLDGVEGQWVFSLYAHSARDGDGLWVGLAQWGEGWQSRTFKLTTEWQRYSFPIKADGDICNILLQPSTGTDSKIWVDGLQFEKGEIPTEFEDNIMP